jgi:hypothetical protein
MDGQLIHESVSSTNWSLERACLPFSPNCLKAIYLDKIMTCLKHWYQQVRVQLSPATLNSTFLVDVGKRSIMDMPDVARKLLEALDHACLSFAESQSEGSVPDLKAHIEDIALALGVFSSRPENLGRRNDYELDDLARQARGRGAEIDQIMRRVRRVFGNRKETCHIPFTILMA